MQWIVSTTVAALVGLGLIVPAAQASEALVGSDSTEHSSMFLDTDDVLWPTAYRFDLGGEKAMNAEVSLWCDNDVVEINQTFTPGSQEIATPLGSTECSVSVFADHDDWEHEGGSSLDIYAILGTPILTRPAADKFLDDGLSRSLNRVYNFGSRKTVSCGVEKAQDRRLCEVSFGGGILKFKGRALVMLHRTGIASGRHLERIRLRMVNLRCLGRTRGKSRQRCVRIVSRQTQAPRVG